MASAGKVGELILRSKQRKKQWVELKGVFLHCYENNTKMHKLDTIDLKFFKEVRPSRTNHLKFKIRYLNNSSYIEFTTLCTEDRDDWVKCIGKAMDSYGSTVKKDNRWEAAIYGWFLLIIMITIIVPVLGALNVKQISFDINIIFVPLLLHELTIIAVCVWYIQQSKYCNIIHTCTFTCEIVVYIFCSVFNLFSFLLTIIYLVKNKNDVDNHSWNFIYFMSNAMVHIFGVFSIPLPAFCLHLHHKSKPNEQNRQLKENNKQYKNSDHEETISISLSNLSQHSIHSSDEKEQYDPIREKRKKNVEKWLKDVGLSQYYGTFIDNAVDDMVSVKLLIPKDLTDMNIKIGHKAKMMSYIDQMKKREHYPPKTYNLLSPAVSSSSNAIFRDDIIKAAMAFCYVAHLLWYILYPIIPQSNHNEFINVIYREQSSLLYRIMYYIIQLFLRTFMGIALTAVFFLFITELVNEKIIVTNYGVFCNIMTDEKMNYKEKCIWLSWFVLLILEVTCMVFQIQFTHVQYYNSYIYYIDLCVNIIWIIVNVFGFVRLFLFVCEFGGIYRKAQHNQEIFFTEILFKQPIVGFVLESLSLLSLYMACIICFANYVLSDYTSELQLICHIVVICRQSSIWLLLCFQFIILFQMKLIQYYADKYLGSFQNRYKPILNCIYKFMCIFLIYNFIYIFIWTIKYFGLSSKKTKYSKMSYSFSFSASTLMVLMLAHFIYSYQQWNDHKKLRTSTVVSVNCSTHSNNRLNEKIKSERKSYKNSWTSSLITTT